LHLWRGKPCLRQAGRRYSASNPFFSSQVDNRKARKTPRAPKPWPAIPAQSAFQLFFEIRKGGLFHPGRQVEEADSLF